MAEQGALPNLPIDPQILQIGHVVPIDQQGGPNVQPGQGQVGAQVAQVAANAAANPVAPVHHLGPPPQALPLPLHHQQPIHLAQ